MLTLFNRKNSKLQESEKEKINQCLLSFMNSTTMILDLPLVNHALKAELEKNAYATLREVAAERVLIYRRTIAPSHLFSHETPDSFQYKRLSGGYSNCTFQIKMSDDAAYISRIPGNGSELFIDRPAEFHNATLAAQLGLNPEVKYNDGIKGKQLSVCLAAPQPLTPELMQSNPRYLTEIAVQLRTLHASKKQFANEANIFKRNEGFHEILAKSEIVLPAAYARIQSVTQHMRVIFANLNIQMVPCHNDTFFNNFLLSDGRLWLIDWEYSGNHDAMWDLSYFAKLANLSEAQRQHLLTIYFDCSDFKNTYFQEYQRLIAYKLIIDEFVLLWAYTQIANTNAAVSNEEFMKWADEALASGLAILEDAEFKMAVSSLEKSSHANAHSQSESAMSSMQAVVSSSQPAEAIINRDKDAPALRFFDVGHPVVSISPLSSSISLPVITSPKLL